MIFIYSGLGGLVIVIGLVAMGICIAILDAFGLPDGDPVLLGLTGILSAVACWAVGRWLNKPTGVDAATNEKQYRWGGPHSLLFIRMEYWAIPYLLFAAIAALAFE